MQAGATLCQPSLTPAFRLDAELAAFFVAQAGLGDGLIASAPVSAEAELRFPLPCVSGIIHESLTRLALLEENTCLERAVHFLRAYAAGEYPPAAPWQSSQSLLSLLRFLSAEALLTFFNQERDPLAELSEAELEWLKLPNFQRFSQLLQPPSAV